MSIKNFGEKLKSARLYKGMSQRSLGLALGLSDKTISSYESERSYPSLEILERISEILNKPVEYFISSSKEVHIEQSLEKINRLLLTIEDEISEIKKTVNKGE